MSGGGELFANGIIITHMLVNALSFLSGISLILLCSRYLQS